MDNLSTSEDRSSKKSKGYRTYFICSLAAGCCWGAVAFVLSLGQFEGAIRGGLLVSPLIGLTIGAINLPIYRFGRVAQAFHSLVMLYLASSLFGLGMGLYEAQMDLPHRNQVEVVYEPILATIWGLTCTGYFLFLWPLSYFTHRILGRTLRAG